MTSPAGNRGDLRARDRLLDAMTISSGAIDSISFLALGKVFTAFMTGNFVFLGLRVAGAPAPAASAILASIIAFALGVYVSTRIVMHQQATDTWPRRVTIALAVSLIAHLGFLAVWFASKGEPQGRTVATLLALWALAMGIQSTAARALHADAVFTTAATATLIFLAGDIANWRATRIERGRLFGILLSLFVGAAAGAFLLVHARLYAPMLPFVVMVVVVVVASGGAVARAQTPGVVP